MARIAATLAEHREGREKVASYTDGRLTLMLYTCRCGWQERGNWADGSTHPAHVASVVAALPDIAIVPTTSVEYAPCWQNEHGVHPLNSTTAWRKGAEDDVERLSADDPEIFLGKHYRTPWIAARAAEGQA